MALTLVTSDLIHSLDYSKLTGTTAAGTVPTWNQNTTGNADTATLAAGATILANTRNINGEAFNGSADITIADATKLPLAGGTLTGTLGGTSATFSGSVTVTKAINLTNSNIAPTGGGIYQGSNLIQIRSGTSGFTVNNNANTVVNFRVADSGAATFSGDVTVNDGGEGLIQMGGTSGLQIIHNNSGNTIAEIKQLYAATSDSAQLKLTGGFTTFHTGTSGTEAMRISSGGEVMIGAIRQLKFSTFDTASASAGHKIDATSANGQIDFATGGTPRLTIESGGDVGIGVTPNAPANGFIQLDIGDNGCGMTSRQNNELILQANANYNTYAQTGVPATRLNLTNSGEFHFLNAPAGSAIGDTITFTERMRISSGGITSLFSNQAKSSASNVDYALLGRTNDLTNYGALQLLQKGANNAADRSWSFQTIDAGLANAGNIVFQPSGGNVGIGTSSPNDILDIRKANSQLRLTDSDDDKFVQFSYSGGKLITRNNSTNTTIAQVTLIENGNFGIGTADPSSKLSIGGNAITTLKPTLVVSDTTNGGSLTLRGQSPIIYFDKTSTGVPKILMDSGGIEFKNGTLDAEGSVHLKISSGGNVSIGTTSIVERLTVSGKVYIEENGVNWNETTPALAIGTQHFDPAGSGADNTGCAITFGASDSGGGATAQAGIYTRSDGSYGTKMYLATTDSYAAGSKTRMMIDHVGSVYIGKTGSDVNVNGWDFNPGGFLTATCNFSNTNEMIVLNQRDGQGTTKVDFRNGNSSRGSINWTTSGTSYGSISDYRLKENVTPITDAISRVNQLKPSRFNFITNSDRTVDGFIAHEVQDIIPEAISGEKDAVREDGTPDYQGIDQSKIVPLLTAAIQEQQAQIELLKQEVELLKQ